MKLRLWSTTRLSVLALNTNTDPVNTAPLLEHSFSAMASPCKFLLPATLPGVQDIARAMEAEVRRIEQKYSRYRDDSVLSNINRNAGQPTTIDDETAWLLNYASVCFSQSDGLFDISSGVLRSVWNFRDGRCPSAEQLHSVLPRIGLAGLRSSNNQLHMPASMELDFGGIGKEYAADAAANIARQRGISWGVVDLGGDLHIIGPRLSDNGEAIPWMLGVRHPREAQSAFASLPVYSGGMATSGDYERYFEANGRRYCHILNPHTGYPVEHWASVTVLAPSCLLAGSLSTISMLKGAAASDWLRQQQLHALLIDTAMQAQALRPTAEQ